MAGGITKGFGITFLILGILLVLAGIVAAAYGFYLGQEAQERGLLADPDQEDLAGALVYGGAVAGGSGLVLLIFGGILAAIGGGMARRELLRAIQGGGAPVSQAAPRRTGWIVAGVIVGILLLAVAVYALAGDSDGGSFGAFNAPDDEPGAAMVIANETFTGYVQGARAPLVGGLNTGNADATHELSLTPGLLALVGTLNWTADMPTSASTLVLILEANNAGTWEELARGEGGPGLMVEVPATSLPDTVRARVFVGGSGVADQEYTLELVARMP